MGSITGWFGYAKKGLKKIAQELQCTCTDIYKIYMQEYSKYQSYILGSIMGWFGYPQKSIDDLACELQFTSDEIFSIYKQGIMNMDSLPLYDNEVNEKLSDYLASLPRNSAYILGCLNGWLDYPKKSVYELVAYYGISKKRLTEIYDQEFQRLKMSLFLEEGKGRK